MTSVGVAAQTDDLHKHRPGGPDSSIHRIGFWGVDPHLSCPDTPRLTGWFGPARGSASQVAGDQQGSGRHLADDGIFAPLADAQAVIVTIINVHRRRA